MLAGGELGLSPAGPQRAQKNSYYVLYSSEVAGPAALTVSTLTWAMGDPGFRLCRGSVVTTPGARSAHAGPSPPSFLAESSLGQFPQPPRAVFPSFPWVKELGQ